MAEEFNALVHNNTWQLVPYCDNMNLLSYKWVYRIKYHSDGSIEHRKACLFVKGFGQLPGLDYNETFIPIVKPTTIHIVLSIVITCGWVIRQFDVKNVFLHGDLREDVFMTQPQGLVHPDFLTHLCKLNKSLYGLKQVPRAWFHKFNGFLLSLGFTYSCTDSSIFILHTQNVILILLL